MDQMCHSESFDLYKFPLGFTFITYCQDPALALVMPGARATYTVCSMSDSYIYVYIYIYRSIDIDMDTEI